MVSVTLDLMTKFNEDERYVPSSAFLLSTFLPARTALTALRSEGSETFASLKICFMTESSRRAKMR